MNIAIPSELPRIIQVLTIEARKTDFYRKVITSGEY